MAASVFLPVDQAYDRWSSIYDSYPNPMVAMASEIVRQSLSDVQGLDVLEFGCGTGRNLATLEGYGARTLTGCDFSPGMLAEARRKSANFHLFQHDMSQALPAIEDQSMDLLLFCLTLEHVRDLRPPLEEARRILRDGGRIAVIEIHPFKSLSGLAAHFRDNAAEEVRMPAYPHQFQDYLLAFEQSGLRVTRCKEWRLAEADPFPLTLEFQLTKL